VTIEIDVARGVIADHAAIMPGVERVGDRTVRFAHDDPETAFRGMLSILRLVEPVSG
jgi:D-aminopeptidase